jgi:quercetin dioxygenase-like cupin family protein
VANSLIGAVWPGKNADTVFRFGRGAVVGWHKQPCGFDALLVIGGPL